MSLKGDISFASYSKYPKNRDGKVCSEHLLMTLICVSTEHLI